MSNLTISPKWNPLINKVEAGEEITGGDLGNANIATRQLAENIFFLKDSIFQLVTESSGSNSEIIAGIVEETRTEFDNIANQIATQNALILAEAQARIKELAEQNAKIKAEADARIAAITATNEALDKELNDRAQAILDESQARQYAMLAEAAAREAALLGESQARQAELLAEATVLNNTITNLDTKIKGTIDSLTEVVTTKITQNATDISSNAAILNALKIEFNGNKASVISQFESIVTDISANSTKIESLKAATDATNAETLVYREAQATADAAMAQEITNLKASTDNGNAQFAQQIQALVDKDAAFTSQLTAMSASFGDDISQLVAKDITLVNADKALSERIVTLTSEFDTNKASIDSQLLTLSNEASSLAQTVSTLKSQTEGSLATIISKQQTLSEENLAQAESLSYISAELDMGYAKKDEYADKNKGSTWTIAKAIAKGDSINSERILGLTAQFNAANATYLSAIQTNADANSATAREITGLSAQLTGGYNGNNLDEISSGLIHQERNARANAVEGLAEQISMLSAGVGEQFDSKEIWHFNYDKENWVNGTWDNGYINVTTETISSPTFTLDGNMYRYVKLRVKRVGNPGWGGLIKWGTKSIAIPEPIFVDDIALVSLDTKWLGPITQIQVKLGATADVTNYYQIDWIAIGRPSPGASMAGLLEVKNAAASRDEALAQSITALDAKLNTKNAELNSSINEKTQTLTTEQQTQATQITSLTSTVETLDQNLSSTISQNNTTLTTKQTALSEAIGLLTAKTDAAAAQLLTDLKTLTDKDTALTQQLTSLTASLGETKAGIVTQNKAFADKDTALTTSITNLTSKVDNNIADVATKIQTLTDTDAANANKFTSITAEFVAANSKIDKATSDIAADKLAIAKNKADITAEANARATADTAQSTRIDTLSATVGTNAASATTRINALVTADTALSERLDVLSTSTDTATGAINSKLTVLTDKDTALTESISQLVTKVDNNQAAVNTKTKALTDDAAALALSVSQLSADYGSNKTAVTQKLEALTNADAANATKVSGLTASFGIVDTRSAKNATDIIDVNDQIIAANKVISKNTADLRAEETARATKDTAIVNSITTLTGIVSGNKVDITQKYDALATEVDANASSLLTLTGTVGTNKTEADQKFAVITNTALSEASKLETLSGKVGTNTTKISQETTARTTADTALGKRVDEVTAKTDNALGRITTAEQVISNNTGSIAQQKIDITTEYNNAINAIEIGGRNLLLDSDFKNKSTNGHIPRYSNLSVIDGVLKRVITSDSGASRFEKAFTLNEIGVFTYSILIQAETQGRFSGSVGISDLSSTAHISGNEYSVATLTFKNTVAGDKIIRYYTSNAPVGEVQFIKWEKLEKGNKATDWSPAPEDITNYVDSEVSKLNTSISSKADISRVDTVESNAIQSLAQAKTELTGNYTTAIATAKTQSAAAAKALADTAQTAAETYALAQANAKAAAALDSAKSDATTKANKAKTDAELAAALDAKNKADEALRLAKLDATAKADAVKGMVNSLSNVVDSKASISRVDAVENNANQALASAKTELTGSYTSAITTAKNDLTEYTNLKSSVVPINSVTKKFINPVGVTGPSTAVGYLIIETPITPTKMCMVKFSGYNYSGGNSNIELSVGFYHYTSSTIQTDFNSTGSYPIEKVQIGRASDSTAVIIIGLPNSVWQYTRGMVSEAIIGYSGTTPDSYVNGWNIKFGTDISAYTSIANITGSHIRSDISNLRTEVESKASISRVDTVENNASQALASAKTELTGSYTSAINAIDIGGRNLLLDSQKWVAQKGSNTILGVNNVGSLGLGSAQAFSANQIYSQRLMVGETYTWSMLVACQGTITNVTLYTGNVFSYTKFTNIENINNSEFIKVWVTAKVTGTNVINSRFHFAVTGTSGSLVYFTDLKVEKGNKATDWTPAPEDVANSINETQTNAAADAKTKADKALADAKADTVIKANAAQTAAQAYALAEANAKSAAALDSAKSDATTKANKARADAELTAAADAKTKADKALADAKVDSAAKTKVVQDALNALTIVVNSKASITSVEKVENDASTALAAVETRLSTNFNRSITTLSDSVNNIQIGGVNLLRDSSALFSKSFAINNDDNGLRSKRITSTSVNVYNNFTAIIGTDITEQFEVGQDYIFSCDVYVVGNIESIRTGLRVDPGATGSIFYDYKPVPVKNKWYRHTQLMNFKTVTSKYLFLLGLGSNIVSNNNYALFKDFKIEKGNISTAWSQTPQEINEYIETVDKKDINTVNHIFNGDFATKSLEKWSNNGSATYALYDGRNTVKLGTTNGIYQNIYTKTPSIFTVTVTAYSPNTTTEIYFGFLNNGAGNSLRMKMMAGWASYRFTSASEIPNGTILHIYSAGASYYVTDIMAVRGNSNVNYSKAPEDYLGYIDTKISDISSVVDSKADISRVNSVESNANGAISQLSDKLTASFTISDTRSVNSTPDWYNSNYPRQTVKEFKTLTAIGLSGQGSYGLLETTISYPGWSGGPAYQTVRPGNNTVWTRTGTNTTWGSWLQQEDTTGSAEKVAAAKRDLDAKLATAQGEINQLKLVTASNTTAIATARTDLTASIKKADNFVTDGEIRVSNADYMLKQYTLDKPFVKGDTYRVTIKGLLGADRTDFRIYNQTGGAFLTALITEEAGVYYGFFKCPTTVPTGIRIYQFVSGRTSTSTVESIEIIRDYDYLEREKLSANISAVNAVTATANGIKAEASVLTNVGGKISGWKNLNTGVSSNFDILADKFTVGTSTLKITPFTVSGSDVVVNVPLKANSSITTPKITGGSLVVGNPCEDFGTGVYVGDDQFIIKSRDASGGIELSSSSRALKVWEGDKIRVQLGKL